MIKVIARKHDGCRSYTTFEGESLFHGIVEPRSYWNSWFAQVKRVAFSTEAGTFAIDQFAYDKVMKIWEEKVLFGELRYKGGEGIVLRRADGPVVIASSPDGSITSNLMWECRAPNGVTLFRVRVPTFSEYCTALLHLDIKTVFLVGEIDRESMKDPAVAILFMFIEMFLDRGGAEGA